MHEIQVLSTHFLIFAAPSYPEPELYLLGAVQGELIENVDPV